MLFIKHTHRHIYTQQQNPRILPEKKTSTHPGLKLPSKRPSTLSGGKPIGISSSTTHNPTTHPTTHPSHNLTSHNPTSHNPTSHNPTSHNPTSHNPTSHSKAIAGGENKKQSFLGPEESKKPPGSSSSKPRPSTKTSQYH